MSATTLDLQVLVYGSSVNDPNDDSRFSGENQRRIEIKLNPRIPMSMMGSMQQKHMWAQGFLQKLGVDVKHTQRWHCEFCDKQARESHLMIASWMHLSPPKLIAYVHLVCNAVTGPCYEKLQMVSMETAIMTGCPPSTPPPFTTANIIFPLAASCGNCKDPNTAKRELNRCSKCKLIRYCGVECQRMDWQRHKEICKTVKDVSWVWKDAPSLRNLD